MFHNNTPKIGYNGLSAYLPSEILLVMVHSSPEAVDEKYYTQKTDIWELCYFTSTFNSPFLIFLEYESKKYP